MNQFNFVPYIPEARVGTGVRLNPRKITVSSHAWEKLGRPTRVAVLLDRARVAIMLSPTQEERGTYRVAKNRQSAEVYLTVAQGMPYGLYPATSDPTIFVHEEKLP